MTSLTPDTFFSSIESDVSATVKAAQGNLEAAVPTCPGWTVRDLLLHTGRIHREKERLIRESRSDQDFEIKLPESDEIAWFERGAKAMLEAFRNIDAGEPIWSWYRPDQTAGFWFRRMAHETLIHRVDAELAAGTLTDINSDIAGDGIDEALRVFVTGFPAWAQFEPLQEIIRLQTPGNSWGLRFGSYSGTTRSGRSFKDVPTVVLEESDAVPDTTISGDAADVNLWLWGRAPVDGLTISGDKSRGDRFRQIAAASM